MFSSKKKDQKEKKNTRTLKASADYASKESVFSDKRRGAIDLITSNGIDASNPEYLIIHDAGVSVYGCGLYIDKLPSRLDIASDFTTLFNYAGVTPGVFIDPMMEESKAAINKRINTLEGEMYGAAKDDGGRNRYRELSGKMADAERWARSLESGENSLYRVSFLFWLIEDSPDKLKNKVINFEGAAKKNGFELASCYGAQLEAFISLYPMNKLYSFDYGKGVFNNLLRQKIVKAHIMDKRSLSTIYNHTNAEFSHRDGVPLGRNLYTGIPICFDPFDPVHSSYGMAVAGMPGSGKSTAMKTLYSRLIDFGYHLVLIDYERHPSGVCGEYAPMTVSVGGISYTISSQKRGNRLNLFEVNEEKEYDYITGSEYRTFHLADKIVDLTNILLAMATSISVTRSEATFPAETLSRMSAIISKLISELFTERGIVNEDPDSLWETVKSGTTLTASRVRKQLPTLHDFYMKLIIASATNTDKFKENAYSLLIDVFEDWVEELYFDPLTFTEYTREQYEQFKPDAKGNRWIEKDGKVRKLVAVRGTKAYFDCQSNVHLDHNRPIVTFDISQIPASERPIMMLVCQNFIEENFIKLNSANPKAAKRLIVSIDESHKVLPYEGARSYLNSLYRTARKRHVAPVLLMQSIADLSRYQDTEDVVKNTETFLLFKHNYADREYIKKVTNISDSQVDTILSLGGDGNPEATPDYVSEGRKTRNNRPGEVAIIEVPTKKTVFMKVEFLPGTEKEIIETNPEEIARMYGERRR